MYLCRRYIIGSLRILDRKIGSDRFLLAVDANTRSPTISVESNAFTSAVVIDSSTLVSLVLRSGCGAYVVALIVEAVSVPMVGFWSAFNASKPQNFAVHPQIPPFPHASPGVICATAFLGYPAMPIQFIVEFVIDNGAHPVG